MSVHPRRWRIAVTALALFVLAPATQWAPARADVAPVATAVAPEVISGPRITGIPALGQQLTVDPGVYTLPITHVQVRWFGNGVPITDTRPIPTLTVAPALVGATLVAEVTAYHDQEGVVSTTLPVVVDRLASSIRVRRQWIAVHGRGTTYDVRLQPEVLVPGLGPDGTNAGTFTASAIGSAASTRTVPPLGPATMRVIDVRLGWHTFTVSYSGSAQAAPSVKTFRMKVKKPAKRR